MCYYSILHLELKYPCLNLNDFEWWKRLCATRRGSLGESVQGGGREGRFGERDSRPADVHVHARRKASVMAVNLPPRCAEGHYSGHVIHVKKVCAI